MKTRQSFVSNSSTTSFVCDICGGAEAGYDSGSCHDYDMNQCCVGYDVKHMWHNNCVPKDRPAATFEQKIQALRESVACRDWNKEWQKEHYDAILAIEKTHDEDALADMLDDIFGGDLPQCECPICTFQVVAKDDAIAFLLKRTSLTMGSLAALIKSEVTSYTEFQQYLKEKTE